MARLKTANMVCLFFAITMAISCGPESSPEGRMNTKIEALQKEMIDSLQQQNKAILDSLAALRKDIRQLQTKE